MKCLISMSKVKILPIWIGSACLMLLVSGTIRAGEIDLSRERILNILKGQNISWKLPNPDHPNYVAVKVLEAFEKEGVSRPEEVLKILEPLQERVFYDVPKKDASKDGVNLYIGPVSGFKIWRELTYLLLGRAYYDLKEYNKAIRNFKSIPLDSELIDFALVGLGWSYIAQNRFDLLESDVVIKEIKPSDLMTRSELDLIRSLYEIARGEFQSAMKSAKVILSKPEMLPIQTRQMAFKVLAEASFRFWVKNSNHWEFAQKVQSLQDVLTISRKIDRNTCDDECAFFIAEAHWNLASMYRVEDPIEFADEAKRSLTEGYSWLKPWIDESLKAKEAKTTEDATFLAIALLWEQRLYAEAAPILTQFHTLFPQGRYREDVYQILADYNFDAGNFTSALSVYRELVKVASTEKSAYGVYKAAWALYNLQDKWAALRHMERLVLFYRNRKVLIDEITGEVKGNSTLTLAKEATGDMIRFLAEIAPAQKAMEEFKVFNYSSDELLTTLSQLSATYTANGRFEDAKKVLVHLLSSNNNRPEAFLWLGDLMDTDLKAATREAIPDHFQKFYPTLPFQSEGPATQSLSGVKTNQQKLESQFGNIILTIHREAKKTDDASIWKVVHASYPLFYKYFPNSSAGPVWYYGAQLLESENHDMEAILWYKKAASIEKFENRQDSALSTLRISQAVLSQLTLKSNVNDLEKKEKYREILSTAGWYNQHFNNTVQKNASDLVLLEALHYLNRDPEAEKYFVDLLNSPTAAEAIKLRAMKARLLREKDWEKAYSLCNHTLEVIGGPQAKAWGLPLQDELKICRQESAFQTAFYSYKDSPKLQRDWYKKAISAHYQAELTFKSWNNLFQSFSVPQELKGMITEAKEFDEFFSRYQASLNSSLNTKEKNFSETTSLVFNLLLKIADAHTLIGEDLAATHWIKLGIKLALNDMPTNPKVDDLRWQLALIYGEYHQTEDFIKAIEDLQSRKSEKLNSPENKRTLARLLFWNSQFKLAWNWLPLQDSDPETHLLLRDLYFYARSEVPIEDWIRKKERELSQDPLLSEVWSSIDRQFGKYSDEKSTLWQPIDDPKDQKELPNKSMDFSNRLKKVEKILSQWKTINSRLSSNLHLTSIEVKAESLCRLKSLDQTAIDELQKISSLSKIENEPNWDDYQSQLLDKLNQLKKEKDRYFKECKVAKEKIRFLQHFKCLSAYQPCFDPKAEPKNSISIIEEWKQKNISSATFINNLLVNHSVGLAQAKAKGVPSQGEKLYLLGLIRLFHEDVWNASLLFEQAAQLEPKLESEISKLLSEIASSPAGGDT